MTHYLKMTWAVVLGKAVILPVLTSNWLLKALFSKLCFQSLAIVSIVSHARLKQDRLYLKELTQR